MIKIVLSTHFDREYKSYVRRDSEKAEILVKSLKKFVDHPNHPGLNLEKLQGSNVWSLRLSKGDRLFFRWLDSQTVFLVDIGPHDKYKRY